ncbi:MAG: hypothetical protein PHQ74_00700 [Crocinitomicaceae bacterium]|nr:hypothetical protein [Crocinitomicaceae bacterium]
MQIKTFFIGLILLLTFSLTSCRSTAPGSNNPTTAAEAEAQLAQRRKEQEKATKKAKKEGEKRYWKMQSKEAKKRVKQTNKRQQRNTKNRNR